MSARMFTSRSSLCTHLDAPPLSPAFGDREFVPVTMNLQCSHSLLAIPALSAAPFSTGTTRTVATCRGGAMPIRIASGCPRSCCNRPEWPPCSTTTRDGCNAFPPSTTWRKPANNPYLHYGCLLYTSDAADEEDSVDLGGRR